MYMYERTQFTAAPIAKSLLIQKVLVVIYTFISVQTKHYKFSMYSVHFIRILYAINAIARGFWQARLNPSVLTKFCTLVLGGRAEGGGNNPFL